MTLDSKDTLDAPVTTQQLVREIMWLREIIEARLDAMDKAMELFNANLTRVPTDTDKQVGNLKELHEAKLENIQRQFTEIKERNSQTSAEQEKALKAALDAQKETTSKTEANTTKQLDSLQKLFETTTKAQSDKIEDIKGTRSEGYQASWTILIAVIGAVVGIGGLIFALVR